MHLAELNFGTLRYPWGDPRIAGFENAIDQVNRIAACSPGFVWRMSDDDMDAAQNDPKGPLADRPNTASTLSVWTGAAPLFRFVTKTLHARIMAGAADWFVYGDSGFLVCWWVPQGHRPEVVEGMTRWRALQRHGQTGNVFAAKGLRDAALAEMRENVG
ncbi:DUF3291 domain-containing protein [Yoonia sp. 2307UL14-13]|uniref:DUF3291 domain-containing protein n=1 Tax=Yoonia sp. 2307UL14-13 TaxID=3126506 RepID=UPI0030B1A1FC